MNRFEDEMLTKMRAEAPNILDSIRKEKKITEENELELKQFIEGFVASFEQAS